MVFLPSKPSACDFYRGSALYMLNTIQHFFRYEKVDFIDLVETDDDHIVKGTSLLVAPRTSLLIAPVLIELVEKEKSVYTGK